MAAPEETVETGVSLEHRPGQAAEFVVTELSRWLIRSLSTIGQGAVAVEDRDIRMDPWADPAGLARESPAQARSC